MVHAERFWAELRTVHETAGRPSVRWLLQNLDSGNATVPKSSALASWLAGETAPAQENTQFFMVLAMHLQKEAVQRSDGEYLAHSKERWSELLIRAQLERRKKQGGRPPLKTRVSKPSAGPVLLPPSPDGFTGRTAELHDVLASLEPDASQTYNGQADSTVVASSVAGMGGIGKTALVLMAAHQARDKGWFPGGILFADLRGYNPGASLDAGAVADRFLRALKVKAKDVPSVSEDKCAAWQQELAKLAAQGRPLLAVLDNVRDPGQIEALLPRSPHRVLITSRQKLSTLPARRIDLAPLRSADAVTLLEQALWAGGTGDARTADEPQSARRLADLCGYLPLALRIIAALLRDQPHRTLHDHADDLAEARTRLDGMAYSGNDREGRPLEVRASFELSYRHLTDTQALTFRLLSVVAGPDISTTAARELLDRPDARRVLDDLARACLLDSREAERWAMHDLIHVFASELGHTHAALDQRKDAIQRLHHHYCTMTAAADTHVDTMPGPGDSRFADRNAALAWLDVEHANLIETAVSATALDRSDTATTLAFSLTRYLTHRRSFDDLIRMFTTALTILMENSELHRVGAALGNLGNALREVRRFEDAITAHTQALTIFRQVHDRHNEGGTLTNLGSALLEVRRFEDAITAHTQAVDIATELGDRHREGSARNSLGSALLEVRRFEDAITAHTQAAEIATELGDRRREGSARINLGIALRKVGRFEEAVAAYTQAAEIAAELGNRHSEGLALTNLCNALREVRKFEEAVTAASQAVDIFREVGDQHGEGQALINLGTSLDQVSKFEEALNTLSQAVDIHRRLAADSQVSHDSGLARALLLLAWAGLNVKGGRALPGARTAAQEAADRYTRLATGRPDQFTELLRTALEVLVTTLERLGRIKEAEQIIRQLEDMEPQRQ